MLTVAVQQTINGIVLGSLYVLVALGLTLIYGVLVQINFAHADIVTAGAFAAYFFTFSFGGNYITSIGVAFSHPASRLPNIPSDMRLGELLRQADAALYRAKSSGKDRWVLYDATTTSRPPSSLPSSADLTRSR